MIGETLAARVATDDDVSYEVVHGVRVEKTSMGAREVVLANVLSQRIMQFLGNDPPGQSVVEVLFAFSPDLERRPMLRLSRSNAGLNGWCRKGMLGQLCLPWRLK